MATLYSSMKFLRFADTLDAVANGRVVPPVHVRIKPINRCNHHCWYCAYRADNLQLGSDMVEADSIPPQKMREITEDLIAMGVKAVTFSGGGEPLLYKTLPETVERLAQGGVRVATLTNGSNLRGRMADAFAAYGTWVRISLDAWDDESYAKSRGVRLGDFSRLMDNIADFAARGSTCVLGVSFIVDRDNHRHVADVCVRLKDAGVNHVKVSGAVVSNDAAETNAYHAEIKAETALQIERACKLRSASFSVLDHYHDIGERFDKDYETCPFLQFLTVIGADLKVYTCQDKAYTSDGTLGSIADRSFRDYWLSNENRIRMAEVDPSRLCRHHCVAHTKNMAILEHLSLDRDHAMFV